MSTVAARVASARPRLGRTRLVGVDGPAGAGKTSFAERLRHAFLASHGWDVQVLHMDDFYEGWSGLNDELLQRIESQVLAQLREEKSGCFQRYDWHRRAFAEWHDVPPRPALILEGVGSGALSFAGSTVLLVWIDAPSETRLARGVRRDGEAMRDEWVRWMTREAEFAAAHRTRERADLHIDGSPRTPLPQDFIALSHNDWVGSA
jgi:chloramphenicol 3-O-phosphotransferase